jgi:hypothetical protein
MRSLTDQFIQVGGRNREFARDAIELDGIELTQLIQLPPVFQPIVERIDQRSNCGKWCA